MATSLFFYDLETSGFDPREARIMQFAGQRTDINLNPVGEPVNHLIKLTPDVVPSPEAILVTGITPQKTISEGITEAEFLKIFYSEVATNDTIFIGYNNVRFDDEFMRYLNYRNYYDAYEWHWSNGRSRWDILDVIRMMRALRPEGIKWPKDKDGKSTNRLEELSRANNIAHEEAHDALSDVNALIELTKLIKGSQPKLFSYLLEIMPSKTKIGELINTGKPFIYTSGKYPSEFEKTTVVAPVVAHPRRQASLVFDLRFDPTEYLNLSPDELAELWYPKEKDAPRLPIKTLQFNRLPAVAPLSVLDDESQKRIKLSMGDISSNFKKLEAGKEKFSKNLLLALSKLDKKQEIKEKNVSEVDERLYEDFVGPADKGLMKKVVNMDSDGLKNSQLKFSDERLNLLFPLYKARNYPKSLDASEVKTWDKFLKRKLFEGKESSRLAKFFNRLTEMSAGSNLSSRDGYLLEELKLYGESIIPSDIESE